MARHSGAQTALALLLAGLPASSGARSAPALTRLWRWRWRLCWWGCRNGRGTTAGTT